MLFARYDWKTTALRTEAVYKKAMAMPRLTFADTLARYGYVVSVCGGCLFTMWRVIVRCGHIGESTRLYARGRGHECAQEIKRVRGTHARATTRERGCQEEERAKVKETVRERGKRDGGGREGGLKLGQRSVGMCSCVFLDTPR